VSIGAKSQATAAWDRRNWVQVTLAAEYSELVAQDDDLNIFGAAGPYSEAGQRPEEAIQDEIHTPQHRSTSALVNAHVRVSGTHRREWHHGGHAACGCELWGYRDCGNHYIDPLEGEHMNQPSEHDNYTAEVAAGYTTGAKDYSAFFSDPHESLEPDRKRFLNALPPGATILDCGCGPGQDAELFSSLGYAVTGIDLTADFVQMARTRVSGARFFEMDMRNISLAPESFDAVWASYSLLHIRRDDLAKVLAGMMRVARDNAIVMIALHRGPETAWLKAKISGMDIDVNVQEWLQEDFERELRVAGFDKLQSRPFERESGRFPLLSVLARRPSRLASKGGAGG
jgi:SAM-dependent methyltransferase